MIATRATLALLVPAYNAAAFLPRLLRSAASQAIPFDAVWVYDDCSIDDTAAVARAHGANVLAGAVNKGCSAGKNALAARVEADFLHFHDADDALLPNFTTLAHRWIAGGAPDVVLFAYEYRDDATDALLLTRTFDPAAAAADPRAYAIREQINPFCGLYRRSAYLAAGGYDEDPAVLYNEDVAFHVAMAFAGLSFGAEPEVSIVHTRRGGAKSGANRLKCIRAHFAVLRKTLARPGADAYRTALAAKLWQVAGLLGAEGDWATADEAVGIAARLAPAPPSAGARWFRAMARVSPTAAMRAREAAIRTFKPSLRGS